MSETPIIFADRERGQSKINKHEALSALWIICRLGVTNWPVSRSLTADRAATAPRSPPARSGGRESALRDAMLAHDIEGNAVGQRPVLVSVLEMRLQPCSKEGSRCWHDPPVEANTYIA